MNIEETGPHHLIYRKCWASYSRSMAECRDEVTPGYQCLKTEKILAIFDLTATKYSYSCTTCEQLLVKYGEFEVNTSEVPNDRGIGRRQRLCEW